MTVECIVVTYNSKEDLQSFARALAPDAFSRVVVVDNCSSDDTVAVARAAGFDVLPQVTNKGFGAAVNAGLAATGGDVIAVLNPDIHVISGQVITHLARSFDDPRLAIAAPGLELPDGSLQDSARDIPTPWQLVRRRVGARRAGAWNSTEALNVPWVVGAFMLMRRAAVERIGGFDPRFFLYFEDVDLCLRLRRDGWTIRYDPTQRVRHQHRGASRGPLLSQSTRLHMRSALLFYRLHGIGLMMSTDL